MQLFSTKPTTSKPGLSTSASVPASLDVKKDIRSQSSCTLVRGGRAKGGSNRRGNVSLGLQQARRAHDSKQKASFVQAEEPDQEESPVAVSSVLAASLVSSLQEYEFRMVNSGSITASSGIWAGAVKFDPTVTAEWSSLNSIFDEYKVVGAKITMIPYFNSSGSTELGTSGPFVILNAGLGLFGTNPTSVANAMEVPNAKVVYLSPGGPHDQYTLSTKVTGLQWQTMGSSGTPYAGAYGQFGLYGSDFYSSTNIISYVFELNVMLRARS